QAAEGGRRRRGVGGGPLARAVAPAGGAGGDGRAGEEAVEVVGEGLGRAVAGAGVFLEALEGDGLQVAVDAAVEGTRGGRVVLDDLEEGLEGGFGAEGGPAGDQPVETGAPGVPVPRRSQRPV